jgi:Fe-S cluster assembly iron-binding protein IscA
MSLRLRVVGGGCAGFSYDLYFDEVTEVDPALRAATASRSSSTR